MVKYCKNCGEALVDGASFCKSCGKPVNETPAQVPQTFYQKDYTISLIIGIFGGFLVPLIGIIIAIFLYTRKDSDKSKQYAGIVAAAAIIGFIYWGFLR